MTDASLERPPEAEPDLVELLERLARARYGFVTPTLATIRHRLERGSPERPDLRDIFGWGFPFRAQHVEPGLLAALECAGELTEAADGLRSNLRAATAEGDLFLHSARPSGGKDTVFLGPDSYRFARLVLGEIGKAPVASILDIGTGAGVGGLVARRHAIGARLVLTDINPRALRLARANLAHARLVGEFVETDGLEGAPEGLDLIVANPPYIAGRTGHTYRDGGDRHGARLSIAWTEAALPRLAPGGRFILYAGSAILDGGLDALAEDLSALARDGGFDLSYAEIDPDIFGGELRRSAYDGVERIAAVGAVFTRPPT